MLVLLLTIQFFCSTRRVKLYITDMYNLTVEVELWKKS